MDSQHTVTRHTILNLCKSIIIVFEFQESLHTVALNQYNHLRMKYLFSLLQCDALRWLCQLWLKSAFVYFSIILYACSTITQNIELQRTYFILLKQNISMHSAHINLIHSRKVDIYIYYH